MGNLALADASDVRVLDPTPTKMTDQINSQEWERVLAPATRLLLFSSYSIFENAFLLKRVNFKTGSLQQQQQPSK